MSSRGTQGATILLTLALIAVTGFALRFERTRGPEGRLGDDASRLALAARGVLADGLPIMPSGRPYLRGLTSSYSTALSFAVFGVTDRAAKIPGVVAGSLLIVAAFLFGRAISEPAGGLWLAAFVAFQPELISWAANGWITMMFVAAFVTAAFFLCRGFGHDERRSQVPAAIVTLFAVLSHELGVLLPISVAIALGIRSMRRDTAWFAGSPTVVAGVILVISLIAFVVLGLALRSGTVAGPAGEFRHYWGPSFSTGRWWADVSRWRAYWPIFIVAAAGVPVVLRRLKPDGVLLYSIAFSVMVAVWVVIDKSSEKYGLVFPVLAGVLALWTTRELLAANPIARRIIVGIVFLIALAPDVRSAWIRPVPQEATWLTEIRMNGFDAGDLVASDDPTVTSHYLGHTDFWPRASEYERYTVAVGGRLRDIYTGATLVPDLATLVGEIRARKESVFWFVGRRDKLRDLPDGVSSLLVRSANLTLEAPDGKLILRIDTSAMKIPSDGPGNR